MYNKILQMTEVKYTYGINVKMQQGLDNSSNKIYLLYYIYIYM